MCEQTEINYLDGDVVWVKLRSYWWPGQVVGLEKLPDDIQAEFQRKPIIAAVKFFQEDSFEFVKNYQQIYKYNCTQKEDFIRKGLDKYRIKSRDGSNYMDKFPEDVKTAEILTNGDPDIILSEKFSPEEKPDISGLFGEKKVPKKKRNRDDSNRKSDDARRKITHPRFLQESDHEVRIRQQTTNVPSSSRSGSSFPCHVCGFTVTRVNVAMLHLKNHIQNNETADTVKAKVKNNSYLKSKQINSDSSKRKYVKKSVPGKNKSDTEPVKRKYNKQNDKPNKKKKSDPELKEKLLADWTGDSDEDDPSSIEKQEYPNSFDESSINQSSMKSVDETKSYIDNSSKDNSESMDLLQESDKLLQETDSFSKFSLLKDVTSEETKSNLDQSEMEKSNNLKSPKKSKDTFHFKKTGVEQPLLKEKNDKEKALLSRFDFHEDDIPEPSISPVRKGARGLGLKKEMIKEFEMQQALKNDEEKELKSNPVSESNEHNEIGEEIEKSETNIENDKRFEKNDEVCETQVEIVEIFEVEKEDEKEIENEIFQLPNEKISHTDVEVATDQEEKMEIDNKIVNEENQQVEKLQMENDKIAEIIYKSPTKKALSEKEENQPVEKLQIENEKIAEIIYKSPTKKALFEKEEINVDEKAHVAPTDKELITDNVLNIMEEDFSTSDTSTTKKSAIEEKDKAILPVALNFDLQNNSDNYSSQDEDKNTAFRDDLNSNVKKRRGRPRKNRVNPEELLSDNEHFKFDDSRKTIDSMESDRKTSESDSDRSSSDKKRKSKKKSQSPLYLQNFDNQLSKNDESLSESDDKSLQEVKSKRKDKKSEKSNDINKVENLKSPLFDNVEFDFAADIPELKERVKESNNLDTQDAPDRSINDIGENNACLDNLNKNEKTDIFVNNDDNYSKEQKSIIEDEVLEEAQNSDVDQLRPKKFQNKKFELNKTDSTNEVSSESTYDSEITNKLTSAEIIEKNETTEVKRDNQEDLENITVTTENLKSPCIVECSEQDAAEKVKSPLKVECTAQDTVEKVKSPWKVDSTEQDAAESSEFLPMEEKSKNSQCDELPQNQLDKTNVEDELVSASNNKIQILETNDTSMKEVQTPSSNQELSIVNFSMMDGFDNIEVVPANDNLNLKSSEGISCDTNNDIATALSSDNKTAEKNNLLLSAEIPVSKSNENLKSLNESNSSASAVSAIEVKVTVPVKKREKPRIIENVALKEPMILKTKLMEKHSGKIGKHKLESDNLKLNELKNSPKAKVMKIEFMGSTSKNKQLIASGNQNILTKKVIKTIKEDDPVVSPVADVRNDKVITSLPKSLSEGQNSEKCIQQSSQSLVDMELDINSMPFVLSEDVLTPESIEQMPVVISSVIPVSSTVATIASTSTTSISSIKQIVSTNQALGSPKEINEVALKKKSGTPAILKSKSKGKPTITSIKTIVPPLSSAAYKAGCKIKTPLTCKKSPGTSYVIVQTSGQQQAYSTHQKVAIPTSKGSGNAQIVQQGGKVVILSSPQSDQPGQKMLPLNISKALSSGKVQRIITTKQAHPSLTAVGSPNIISSKTLNASKSSDASPTTSPKVVGQKILNQQLIPSKSVLTQMPGTIGKSTVLGSLPQSILTKDVIYTPLNSATLGGKTIIGSKTLVKSFSPQSLGTSKNIITPITTSIAGKTIINSQGLVTKGTVLTPITGSQVKALAAKNIKGNKVQHQGAQRKVQMTVSKNQTIPVSPSSARSAVNVKASNVVLLQNSELKTVALNKKVISKPISQTVKKQTVTSVLSPSGVLPAHQKSKLPSTSVEGKSVAHKNATQTIKLQKIIADKKDEEDVELKSGVSSEILVQNVKVEDQVNQKKAALKIEKNLQKNSQKRISNVKSSVIASESVLSAPDLKIPFLESSTHDKMPKKEEIPEQINPKVDVASSIAQVATVETEKTEEPKISAQAQIMALPTESSDGTQTYVLLTVDEQGRIIPLDNNTLVTLDGTSNFDGSKTLYIDPSSLNESGNMDNIVLQIDNGSLSNIQPVTSTEQTESAIMESLPSAEVGQRSNQDILAAALANTDFQHEVNVAEVAGSNAMTSLTQTQTSLINQTILQSTIIPPTEPISSPLVLETSLTLGQPIMTPLEVPSNVSIQPELASVTPNMSARRVSQNALYIAMEESLPISNNSMPEIEETEMKNVTETDLNEKKPDKSSEMDISYSISVCEGNYDKKEIDTPSLPMIDESFSANSGFDSTNASVVQDNLKSYVTKTSEELIEDLTGNDSLQESSERTTVESVSNEKSCSEMQELIFESPKEEILQKNQEDECVSTEECATTEASENVESSEERANEKLTSCEANREELCNSSIESIMEVESSQEVGIEEQKEQKDQTEQIAVPVESGDDVKEEQANLCQTSEDCQSRSDGVQDIKINFEDSEDAPSQSYEEFVSATSDIAEVPSQSAKSESSQEATEGPLSEEPPSQSYGDLKHIDAPSQSFNCEMLNEDKSASMDGPNFPTQSFEVEKMENFEENMENDTERSEEGNIPSQSNEVGEGEGIGTSSGHCALNEDETASSSYVPETPENQERDQDQESAISTSSYEIPPCEELNIASSSVIPDTSVHSELSEHSNIHNNGVPEIPTSSYSLNSLHSLNSLNNPDSSSTHIDAVPTSSYEDQIVLEQNVSTSYQVSLAQLEESSSQNYVTDSSEERNEPTSYYAHHQDVSEGYYENVCKESSPRLEAEEAQPSYYGSNPSDETSEASQSYFNQEATPSYSEHEISPSFYDPRTEAEATQSFYSSAAPAASASSQSPFYQEAAHEQRLVQGGEATPTDYTDRYSVDYASVSSPLDRHDLVESSVPARSMDR